MTVLFCFEFTKINLLLHVIFEKYRLCPLEGAIDTFMFLFFFLFLFLQEIQHLQTEVEQVKNDIWETTMRPIS